MLRTFFFCIKWRKSSRQSWWRTAAPPRWEEPEEEARTCGPEASLVRCSWNVPTGRVHPEEERLSACSNWPAARYFYPPPLRVLVGVNNPPRRALLQTNCKVSKETPSWFWLRILSDFLQQLQSGNAGWVICFNSFLQSPQKMFEGEKCVF